MVSISVPFCWVVLLCFLRLSVRLCTLTLAGTRFSRELKVTRECVISVNTVFFFPTGFECFKCYGRKLGSDDTDFGCVTINFTWYLPPPPIRLCDILTIPLIGSKLVLATAVRHRKNYEIAPKSGKNYGNFLRATLITLRASSYSPLNDIKNQDDLLRQGI